MTTDEKIGQMGAAAAEKIDFDGAAVRNYLLGSVLNGMGGGAVMLPSNSVAAWCDLTDRAQGYALETRLHIPEIYAIDAVHGHGNVYGATIFPHNVGLGADRRSCPDSSHRSGYRGGNKGDWDALGLRARGGYWA